MSTALYRRYRPDTFDEVIGQEHVTDPLKAALASGRVNHAYLFSGPRGCGKTTSARILARCLNCAQGPTPTPCGECESCRDLATGGPGSLDVVEIDAASNSGVDDARDLRERAVYAPARDRYKVFILDEAHMVTPQGFNALLKLVEEPPAHVKFIFATTEPEKVIGTIRSRTHHYPFRLVPPDTMSTYLGQLCSRENVPVGKGVLPLVVRAGGGSVRDSLSVLDQLIAGSGPDGIDYATATALLGYTPDSLLGDIVDAFSAGDAAAVFRVVDRVIDSGQDPRRFVEDLLERFRDVLIISTAPQSARAFLPQAPEDLLERLVQQSRTFGPAELSRAADLLNAGLSEMTGATSPRLQLELICARILLPAMDAARSSVLARVERMERRIGMSASGAAGAVPAASAQGEAGAEPAESVRGEQADSPRAESAAAEPQAAQQPAEERPASPAGPDSGQADAVRPAEAQPEPARPQPAAAPEDSAWDSLGDIADLASHAEALAEASAAGGAAEARGGEHAPEAAPQSPAAEQEPAAAAAGRAPQPEPAPSAAAPARPGGEDIDAVRRSWQAILDVVGRSAKLARAVLAGNAVPQQVADGTLLLAFKNPGAVAAFQRGANPEILARAVHDVLGMQLAIDIGQVGEHVSLRIDAAPPGSQAPSTHGVPEAPQHRGPAEQPVRPRHQRPTQAQIDAVVGAQAMDQELPDREQYWQSADADDEEGDHPGVPVDPGPAEDAGFGPDDAYAPADEPGFDPDDSFGPDDAPGPDAGFGHAAGVDAAGADAVLDTAADAPVDAPVNTAAGEGAVHAPDVVVPPPADIDVLGAYADESVFADPSPTDAAREAPARTAPPRRAERRTEPRTEPRGQSAAPEPASAQWPEEPPTAAAPGWDEPDVNIDEDLDISESPEVGVPVVARILGGVVLEEVTE